MLLIYTQVHVHEGSRSERRNESVELVISRAPKFKNPYVHDAGSDGIFTPFGALLLALRPSPVHDTKDEKIN